MPSPLVGEGGAQRRVRGFHCSLLTAHCSLVTVFASAALIAHCPRDAEAVSQCRLLPTSIQEAFREPAIPRSWAADTRPRVARSILSGVLGPSRVPALQDGLPALRILHVLLRIRV